jgi:hypothetical protein
MAISRIQGQILSDNLTRSGVNLAIETDLLFFDVTNDRIGIKDGTPSDTLSVNGTTALTGTLTVSGNSTLATVKISDLTSGRIVYSGTAGELQDNANLTFDGTTLTIDSISAEVGNSLTISSDVDLNLTADSNSNGTGLVTVTGTTGFGLPLGTTAQRPSTAIQGTLRFNTFTNQVEVYNGSAWTEVGDNLVDLTSVVLNGDGVTTAFTLPENTNAVSLIVSINGVVQLPNVSYTVSGTTITFVEAPAISDKVDVRFIANITTVSAISDASGTTYVEASSSTISNVVNSSTLMEIASDEIINISNAHSLQLPTYDTTQANALTNVASGQIIYMTDVGGGNPRLSLFNGTAWTSVSTTGLSLGNWTITENAGTLYFATSGVNMMKIDSTGNLTCIGSVTAYGTV